jgi:hypothetical protein
MSKTEIKMSKCDVSIEPIIVVECDDCSWPATHHISIDMRAIGTVYDFGHFCEVHAKERAEAVKASLPEDGDD